PPPPPLFPSTTLFRSPDRDAAVPPAVRGRGLERAPACAAAEADARRARAAGCPRAGDREGALEVAARPLRELRRAPRRRTRRGRRAARPSAAARRVADAARARGGARRGGGPRDPDARRPPGREGR